MLVKRIFKSFCQVSVEWFCSLMRHLVDELPLVYGSGFSNLEALTGLDTNSHFLWRKLQNGEGEWKFSQRGISSLRLRTHKTEPSLAKII